MAELKDKLVDLEALKELHTYNINSFSRSIDDSQASPTNPWSGEKVDAELAAAKEELSNSMSKIPVLFEGTSIHATETVDENMTINRRNVEILGQTIQNCLDHSSVDKFSSLGGTIEGGYIVLTGSGNFVNFFLNRNSGVIKPSTQYTFVIDIAENTLVGDADASLAFGDTTTNETPFLYSSELVITDGKTGIYKFRLTSKASVSGTEKYFDRGFLSSKAKSGIIKFRYAIVEGDWANKDISWVPFGLNTPQTTEIIMENGDASERNAVTIRGPLGSVSDTIRDRVYLKDGKAYYEQNVASAVFDGSEDENWSAYTQQGMPNTYICTGILGQIGKVAIPFSCISDRYVRKYNFTMQNNGVANGAKDIVIRDDNYTTVENFVDYLQGSPITVIYQLATPITTEIQLSDFYSYEEQTNWYTTNAVKPTLKAEFYVDRLISTADRDAKIDKSISELTENVNELRELRDLLLSDDEIWTFDRIQYVVQTGRDKNYFSVGDQIKPNWKDGETVYEDPFDIVQMGKTYELEDGSIINGLMLQQHYANIKGCPFDAQEALYDADEELPAGTYHFTVAGDTWLSSENGKVIQFTLTQPIPAGGQLVYANTEGYNKEIAGQNICTYASPTSFTAIETVALSEGSEGTDLGRTDGKGNLNHHQRAFRGCGRWKTSMLRQYLNSAKPAGEWWTKQDKWDRASSFISSCAGYLVGFDADFLAIIKPVKVQTARDTVVYDGGTDVTYDMFFPISLEQLNAAPQISGVEGSALDYWKAVAAADTTGNLDSNGRFKQYGTYPDLRVYGLNAKTTARYCWLRSALRGNSCIAWYVSTSGYVGSSHALYGNYCAPACVIC